MVAIYCYLERNNNKALKFHLNNFFCAKGFTRGNTVLLCQFMRILTSFLFQYVTRLPQVDSSLISCQSGFNSQVFNCLK